MGLDFKIGTSCEFYVFELDEKGMPTTIPHDRAGCCDVAPMDRGENLRRDICMTLEQMEIYPESSRHEKGPGQNEIDFVSSSPLSAADNLVTFKNTVKSVSARNGLYASFMPKPLEDKIGSSLKIIISCTKNGDDVFAQRNGCLNRFGDRMIGGLIKNLPAMTMFFNGVTNSYSRIGAIEPMKYISWTKYNLNAPIRLRRTSNGNGVAVCTPDNTCNPYFALGLIINACLDGIANNYTAPDPVTEDISKAENDVKNTFERLPENLCDAVKAAENSKFIKESLPEKMLKYTVSKKTEMCDEFKKAENKEEYEMKKYFGTL
jgi:glutamine synthetase